MRWRFFGKVVFRLSYLWYRSVTIKSFAAEFSYSGISLVRLSYFNSVNNEKVAAVVTGFLFNFKPLLWLDLELIGTRQKESFETVKRFPVSPDSHCFGKLMVWDGDENRMDFEKLRVANQQRHLEWAKGEELPLSFRGVELAGEVGEACNEIKKLERHRMGIVGGKVDLSGLRDELADILISVDLIAMDLDIDLGQTVKEKFNQTSEKYGLETRL